MVNLVLVLASLVGSASASDIVASDPTYGACFDTVLKRLSSEYEGCNKYIQIPTNVPGSEDVSIGGVVCGNWAANYLLMEVPVRARTLTAEQLVADLELGPWLDLDRAKLIAAQSAAPLCLGEELMVIDETAMNAVLDVPPPKHPRKSGEIKITVKR